MTKKIIAIFKKVFKTDEIDENASQQNIALWDSLGHLNLVIELEDEFNVAFEPEEIVAMKNLKTIEELLKTKDVK
jgi:acyl carrier protein